MSLLRFWAAACVAAVGVAAFFLTAAAHSNPVRFDPSPGSVLEAAPESVTGWFTSDLRREAGSFLRVLNEHGEHVDAGETVLSDDRRQMTVSLPSGLGDGRYLVHWSTHDDGDGEVFSGCFYFFVGQAAAAAALVNGISLDGGADCPAAADHDHKEGEGQHDAEDGSMDMEPAISLHLPDVVEGGSFTLEIEPANFTPRAPDGNTVDSNFGHYHIYLDKVPLDLLGGSHGHAAEGHEGSDGETKMETADPNGLVENPIMWFENTYEFTDLQPGIHTVTVVLNHDDHSPSDPPVIASTTFRVAGDNGDDGVPAWTLVVTGAIGLIGLAVGGFALLGRRS